MVLAVSVLFVGSVEVNEVEASQVAGYNPDKVAPPYNNLKPVKKAPPYGNNLKPVDIPMKTPSQPKFI